MPLIIRFTWQDYKTKLQLSWGKLRREPATKWFDESFAPMPMFDERFARQYRCEPPPEFPLASPCTGIVHHLSGPNRCALTRTSHRRSWSVDGAGEPAQKSETPLATSAGRACLHFHCAFSYIWFSTKRLAHMLDSLVRVSRRAWWAHLLWIQRTVTCGMTAESPPHTPQNSFWSECSRAEQTRPPPKQHGQMNGQALGCLRQVGLSAAASSSRCTKWYNSTQTRADSLYKQTQRIQSPQPM